MADLLGRIGSFLVELKRRKVYRVTIVYVVVAAGAIELVDIILPASRLPDWSDELLLGLALFGLPLAMVLAWAFDVTPEGVRRASGPPAEVEEEAPPAPPPAQPSQDATRTSQMVVEGGSAELDPRAVAVLPFENLSGTAEAEPFAAGLHDDLLTELSALSALKVISRTSVTSYRDSGASIPQIARELGVGTVVEGAVQYAAGRVRLNVQLIDARVDAHRWVERYDRELTAEGIFDLQSELSEAIATALHANLTPKEKARVRRAPTDNLTAYRLLSEGRSHLDQRTESSAHRALESFREALRLDPDYGLAWAGLAQAVGIFEFYDYDMPPDAPDAMKAARRAVELAPSTGEAHTALGIIHSLRNQGALARTTLERALELKPSDAEASMWLAWIHLVLGDPQRAMEPAARAAELDPLAPAARVFLAEAHLANGDPEDALLEARTARQLQPDYALARFMEGLALYHLDRLDEARAGLEEVLPLLRPRGSPSPPEVRALLALTHLRLGETGETRRLLERVQEEDSPFSFGLIQAALGDTDAAFDAFHDVSRWRSFATEHLRYFFPQVLGPLREDPRYAELLERVDRSWHRSRST